MGPIAYTKVSCFLPWVALQFGLYFPPADDDACVSGQGKKPPFNSTHEYDSTCRSTVASDLFGDERECIFPFYWGDKLYTTCALYSPANLAVPLFVCPTRNITTKYPGTDINYFPDIDLRETYWVDTAHLETTCLQNTGQAAGQACVAYNNAYQFCDTANCDELLNPDITGYGFNGEPGKSSWNIRWLPFSTCKTDCPGVKGFGIIGGGAVLFSASALAGQTILPFLGLGAVATTIGGGAVTRAMCSTPWCTSRSGQCCLLMLSRRGRAICPRSC